MESILIEVSIGVAVLVFVMAITSDIKAIGAEKRIEQCLKEAILAREKLAQEKRAQEKKTCSRRGTCKDPAVKSKTC